MPFTYELSKIHQAEKPRSDATTPEAVELQALYDGAASNPEKAKEYQARLDELKAQGHQFRLTKAKVFEVFEEKGSVCEAAIKFQVKGNVITWSFKSPIDETTQEFRDILYTTAADAHDKVENGCERYYRGTNSYHVKKMHTHEGESNFNHNHYRRADGLDITPKEVAEHLRAFKDHKNGKFFFPDFNEIDEIIDAFTKYWQEWTQESKYDKNGSLLNQYATEKSQKLDDEDLQEEKEHLKEQEPCRVDVSSIPKHELAEIQAMRTRGIGSERALLRQVAGSDLKAIDKNQVVKMDDRSTALPAPTASVASVSMFGTSAQTATVSSSTTTSEPKKEDQGNKLG